MKLIQTDHDIFLQETEVKPNRYAAIVLSLCVITIVLCQILTEIGIFRVGKTEMRIGSAITFLSSAIPLTMLVFFPKSRSAGSTKFFIVAAITIFTFSAGIFLTFHTTILLIFPIFFAMLYRSKAVGVFAAIASLSATVFTPVIGYLLGTWDVPLFQELILIATNGNAVIEGAYEGLSLLNVGKILLYIVFPRLLLVGSCTGLMFYVIWISVAHVETQIILNNLSQRDALTGLYNQNCFMDVLEHAAQDKVHGNDTVSVLFFDTNDLKAANDSHGHEFGDLLLQCCADSLLPFCDDETFYGFRVGGDEFAAILPGADESKADKALTSWKEALDRFNSDEQSTKHLRGSTVSMASGLASGFYRDLDQIVRQADAQMYKNKQAMKGLPA